MSRGSRHRQVCRQGMLGIWWREAVRLGRQKNSRKKCTERRQAGRSREHGGRW